MLSRLQSLIYALRGIQLGFYGVNFKIQVCMGLLAMVMAAASKIEVAECLFIMLCISIVLAGELFNTAIEKLCDHVHPAHHPNIGQVKDLAAGAVLVLSIGSAIVGLCIFIPALWCN